MTWRQDKCGTIDNDDRMGGTHIQLKYKDITHLALNQIYSFDIQYDLSIGLQAPLLHIPDIILHREEDLSFVLAVCSCTAAGGME